MEVLYNSNIANRSQLLGDLGRQDREMFQRMDHGLDCQPEYVFMSTIFSALCRKRLLAF
jgi:hypothetical protein